MTLSGAGNTFTAPLSPTTKPYSASCTTLFDPGFSGDCVTVAAPSGTIAALVESPENTNGIPSQPMAERDLVYRDVNNAWSLVLRRTPTESGDRSQVYESDIMRDHDPKAVFVEPAQNSEFGNELDVIEASGAVTLYRQLHGGFAYVPATGGLDTYVPDPASGYDEATIIYKDGAWTIVSASPVSDSQAQALSTEPFSDPEAPEPTFGSNNT